MAKSKDARVIFFWNVPVLEMVSIYKKNHEALHDILVKGIGTTLSQLELRKFCLYCHKHMIHGEIKK